MEAEPDADCSRGYRLCVCVCEHLYWLFINVHTNLPNIWAHLNLNIYVGQNSNW